MRPEHIRHLVPVSAAARAALLLLLAGLLSGCGLLGKVHLDPFSSSPAPRAATGTNPVVRTAESVMGTPYKWGGDSPREGFDCSGFVYWAFAENGVRIPRVSWEQVNTGQRIRRADLRAGDLVFFDTGQKRGFHVGLATGRGTFLHSPKAGSRVSESSLDNSYWYRRFMFGRRVADPASLASR
ncbi:MAG: C40 family peptidase [Desulfovibrionaceae bacterium]